MDRRQRSRQPRGRSLARSVRQLWLAAAAALVVTYAGLLWRASWTDPAPAAVTAAEQAALADTSARTTAPTALDAEDKRENGQLRAVGNELPSGLLNVVREGGGGGDAADGMLRVAGNERPDELPSEINGGDGDDEGEVLRIDAGDTDMASHASRTSSTKAIPAAMMEDEVPFASTKASSEAKATEPEEKAELQEDVLHPEHEFTGVDVLPVKEDVLEPGHEFTNVDALPVKEDVLEPGHEFTNADALPVKEDALEDGHEFTNADALPVREDVTDGSADAHLFTDASYFDDLMLQGNAQDDEEKAHEFTDASYFDKLMAMEPTDKIERGGSHQFSDVSNFDDAAVAEEEEEELEELPPVKFTRFDESRLVQYVEASSQAVPMEQRHDIIAGYDATIEYLANYSTPEDSNEQLFLFFVCSDANGTAFDWKPVCADAKKAVYDVFARSPSSNRLVTIYAGPEEVWKHTNMLKEDDDLRLKSIPSIMRWDGGTPGAKRSTYGMMIDETVLSEPFLRYLFRNTDQVDERLAQPDVKTKEIVTVKGYEQYSRFIDSYKQDAEAYPLFMILMSGRWKSNNRLWCPFSRQSELPLEYAFYAFAPRDSRFLIVETYDLYKEWKNPENEFKRDPILHPKGVPWFLRVYPEAGGTLLFQRVKQRLYMLDSLRLAFEDSE